MSLLLAATLAAGMLGRPAHEDGGCGKEILQRATTATADEATGPGTPSAQPRPRPVHTP
jgi:hypothetical protein